MKELLNEHLEEHFERFLEDSLPDCLQTSLKGFQEELYEEYLKVLRRNCCMNHLGEFSKKTTREIFGGRILVEIAGFFFCKIPETISG